MKTPSVQSPVAVDLLVVGLTLAAPVLGASTSLWSKAVLLIGAAIAWFMDPPARTLPRGVGALFALLALSGFVALLPRAWFGTAPWEGPLQELGLLLPATLSAQPWLTLEKALLLCGGIIWAWYLLCRRWHTPRVTLFGLFAVGVLAITLWSLYAHVRPDAPVAGGAGGQFGIFRSRNQTANFTALGALVMLALAGEGFLSRRRSAGLWIAAAAMASAAVMFAGSRAGVVLLGLGSFAWLGWMARLMRKGTWLAAGVSALLLFLSALVVFRAGLAERFRSFGGIRTEETLDFRVLIHQDAVPLAGAASWHGIGLGNFEPVFAMYRNSSANPNRALHPESDWLWLLIEAGWFAPVLAWAAFALLARRCWPFAPGTDRPLRSVALVCATLFVLHGFVDVSGHHVGTLWPALLLLALSQNADWAAARAPRRWIHAAPALAGAVGLAFLLSATGLAPLPTSATLSSLKRRIDQALREDQFAAALGPVEKALRIAPLDWELHFARGTARALTRVVTTAAAADFAIALQLEPNPAIAFDAGRVWLSRDAQYVEKDYFLGREPERAAEAWRALLRRHPRRELEFFEQMLAEARGYPEMLPHLREMARGKPALLLDYAIGSNANDFDDVCRELLAVDPALEVASGTRRRQLFRVWAGRGDHAALESALEAHPEWMEFAWPWYGDLLERRGEFEHACENARRFLDRAPLPVVAGNVTLGAARAAHESRPRDLAAGIIYLQKLLDASETGEARALLRRLNALPDAPDYLHALEADLAYAARDFKLAWSAWRRAAPR